ncbi:hypothetical protein MES5069_450033 [Mesorhizobium escarrei]|uniref:Uncharacterized protein n=1 Tax=Mesorhizobium escarrei TaxID=666018 RepID=A0ABN8K6N5_9HYPH|nr:hypothetical protein MES5069_450033 [Mesorhizobium escarrei]
MIVRFQQELNHYLLWWVCSMAVMGSLIMAYGNIPFPAETPPPVHCCLRGRKGRRIMRLTGSMRTHSAEAAARPRSGSPAPRRGKDTSGGQMLNAIRKIQAAARALGPRIRSAHA